jgi:hypothetical protein
MMPRQASIHRDEGIEDIKLQRLVRNGRLQARQIFQARLAKVGVAERKINVGPEVAEGVAGIVVIASKMQAEKGIAFAQEI